MFIEELKDKTIEERERYFREVAAAIGMCNSRIEIMQRTIVCLRSGDAKVNILRSRMTDHAEIPDDLQEEVRQVLADLLDRRCHELRRSKMAELRFSDEESY